MEEKIKELRAAIEQASADVTDKARLSDFWQKYLSKNGEVAGLTKSLRDVPKEDRPAVGKTINEFKQWPRHSIRPCPSRSKRPRSRPATPPRPSTSRCRKIVNRQPAPITLVKNVDHRRVRRYGL